MEYLKKCIMMNAHYIIAINPTIKDAIDPLLLQKSLDMVSEWLKSGF